MRQCTAVAAKCNIEILQQWVRFAMLLSNAADRETGRQTKRQVDGRTDGRTEKQTDEQDRQADKSNQTNKHFSE
jgi:hypothetical protein